MNDTLLPDEIEGEIKAGDWVRIRKPEEAQEDIQRYTVVAPVKLSKTKDFLTKPWQVFKVDKDGDAFTKGLYIDGYASISALVRLAPPAPPETVEVDGHLYKLVK